MRIRDTLQGRNCKWKRDEGNGIRLSSVEWRSSDCNVARTSWRWRKSWGFIGSFYTGGAINWPRQTSAMNRCRRTRVNPRSAKRSASSSECWPKRLWSWIFSKVPCKKERLDAGRTVSVARRHLRRNPRTDAFARQLKHRAHVSVGRGQPSRFLSFSAGASTGRGRHGGAQCDATDRHRASLSLRLSADQRRVTAARDGGKSQACVTDDAGRQPAGGAAAGVRGDHGFRSRVRGLPESGQPNETDGD